jgi:hypothetical protein
MLLKIIKINITIITWTLCIVTFISQLVKLENNMAMNHVDIGVLSPEVMTPSMGIDLLL